MTKTALVITTRDRAELVRETLASAIKQTVPFSRIVISENSSSNEERNLTIETLKPLVEQYPEKKITIRATPREFTSDEHTAFMQTHLTGDEEYSVLFHDDDLMEPAYHANLRKILDNDPEAVAVCCNARVLLEGTPTSKTTIGLQQGRVEINSPVELLTTYLGFSPIGPPPLCGYMHRTAILKQLSFSRFNGGKYSDVAALTQLASKGKIIWLSESLMQYRVHANQDSQRVNTRDYRLLINYLQKEDWLPTGSPLFETYRFKHLRLKLPTMNKQTKRRSAALIRLYLFRAVLCTYLFKPSFHLHLARRLFGR